MSSTAAVSRFQDQFPSGPRLTIVAAAAECEELANGLTRCRSQSGSTVTYGDDSGWVKFQSFKSGILPRKIGTRITTFGAKYEAARIDSRYYLPAHGQTVKIGKVDHDSEVKVDNLLDEFESAYFGELPIRVESLCRVQWNGHRISDVVAQGSIDNYFIFGDVPPFPGGWPADWPDLPTPEPAPQVSLAPWSLRFAPRITNPVSTKSILITSTFGVPKRVRVGAAVSDDASRPNPFSAQSGTFTVPADGQLRIDVDFDGSLTTGGVGQMSLLPAVTGSFPVDIGNGREYQIGLLGQMMPVFAIG